MHVNGSGGSFVENDYELAPEVAWQLGLQVCREMNVDVETQDDAGMLLNGSLLTSSPVSGRKATPSPSIFWAKAGSFTCSREIRLPVTGATSCTFVFLKKNPIGKYLTLSDIFSIVT